MIYEFQATQDLHGYDKPWAPGTNINIFDGLMELGTISTENGNTVDSLNRLRSADYIPVKPSTSYCFYQGIPATGNVQTGRAAYYDENKDFILGDGSFPTGSYTFPRNGVFTTPENAAFLKFSPYGDYGIDTTIIDKLAINYPSTEQGYTSYDNVCMPEGFNIWDPTNQEYIQVYAGYVNANTRELYLRPVYEEYAGEELVGPWMSSLDPYSEDATPTEGAFVIDFGGELTSYEITPFMLQTLLDSLGIRQHFTDGAGLLNKLMDQAQGRVRSEEELLHLSRPLNVIAIGDQLPAGLTFKPISKDVLPGLPGKFIR